MARISSPLMTACTPGMASARDLSMRAYQRMGVRRADHMCAESAGRHRHIIRKPAFADEQRGIFLSPHRFAEQ